MIDSNVKKIAVLLVDPKTNANWSIFFDVGTKYIVKLGDYMRAAKCHYSLYDMRVVGLVEIRDDQFDGIQHGTIINRWI